MDHQLAAHDLLAALNAIGHSLQEAFDPQRFLAEFSTHLQQLVPHDRLLLVFLEEGGRLSVLAEHAQRGPLLHQGRYTTDFDPAGRYTSEQISLGSVLAGGTMVVRDFQTDPRFALPGAALPSATKIGLRARVAAPLISGRRVLGALLVGSFTPDAYTEAHAAAVRQVTDLIAPFIENLVLLHREQRRRGRLAALTGLARVFGASLQLAENFEQVAEAVRPVLDFDVMGVRLRRDGGREMVLVGRVSDLPSPPGPARIPFDDLSFSATVEAGAPVLVRDAQRELDPDRPGDRRILERGNRSCLSVPLWFAESVGGILFFAKRQPDWFDGADVEVAQAIAAQVVVALQHQRLAEEQQHRAQAEGQARHLEQRLTRLRRELGTRYGFDRILGRAPTLREALDRAAKVASTETTVLLTGESGTGKELFARAIHHASPRAEGPYVAINCAAIPETLVESELFGHERGAFTGADKLRAGRFETAAGGTLFLDEVAELPPAVQAKLLRVLQEHELQRVGGTETLRTDVRLIAACNRDLRQAVAEGRFREDLYYRLNVFTVHLPPLRERGGDILLLADHLVRELGAKLGKGEPGISRDAQVALRAYPWPGNVRELANAIERALILADGGLLTADDLGIGGPSATPRTGREPLAASTAAVPEPLAEAERRAVLAALAHTRGNKTQAAALLGISRTQLHNRLKRLGGIGEPAA